MGHFSRWVLENPYTLGIICYVLVVVPIMGIWAIHKYDWQHWAPFDKGHKKQYNYFCWEAKPLNATGCKSAVDGLLWEQEDTGSIPVTPIASFITGTLDTKVSNLIILRQQFKTMSLIQKFKKDVSTLRSAANGEFYLDVKSPKLYKKVRRFYENEGVVFSGDPLDDYEMLMEYVASDLEVVEA